MNRKRFAKITSLLLAFILMLSLVSCQTEEEEPVDNGEETEETVDEEETEETARFDLADFEDYKYGDWLPFDEDGEFVQDGRDAEGENGVVSSQKYEASKIGVEIMEAGGNAVDAAVASSFALGVVEPNASGLGGGGFMTLRDGETGEVLFIDFREVAPLNATEDMYPLDEEDEVIGDVKKRGGLAVAVPGEVKGLLYILEEYGTMSREEVMQPAIDLANEGFLITPKIGTAISDAYDLMQDYPELGDLYLEDNLPIEAGSIITNPDLAKTLEKIAEEGADGFYKGEVAEAIVASAEKYDGILTLEDLETYEVEVMEPVAGEYRGHEIISSPPPSSGGTHLIQIMNMWENYDIGEMELHGKEHLHLMSETFKIAYQDRAEYMGDPEYVDVPIEGLKSKDYAEHLVEKIDEDKSQEFEADDPWKYEKDNTTHLSVADKDGNMVGITKTINYYFGSAVVADGYGFILNNEMDDFSPVPGGPNSVAPKKKPLSSMSPTIVLKEGEPFMVLGAPGGVSIFPQVAQVISHVIDRDMNLQEAIDLPRVLNTTANTFRYMKEIDEDVIKELEEMGHEVSLNEGSFGFVQAVQYLEGGSLYGGADRGNDAKAVGY